MGRIVLSEEFKEDVRRVWEKGSKVVLERAENEVWRLHLNGEDFDDQVSDAGELGILVGESRAEGSEAFFARFTDWLNSHTEDDEEEAE